jgi:hypothetical protein
MRSVSTLISRTAVAYVGLAPGSMVSASPSLAGSSFNKETVT